MNSKFQKLVEDILEFHFETYPTAATFWGIHKYDDRLDNWNKEFREDKIKKEKALLSQLKSFSGKLSGDDQLDYEVLVRELELGIKLEESYRKWERDSGFYPELALMGSYILLAREFAPVTVRMRSFLGRVREIPRFLEEAKQNLKTGLNIPRIWTETGIEVTKAGKSFFTETVPEAVSRVPDIKSEILDASRDAVNAFEDYLEFLQKEMLPRSKGDFQLGEENFNWILKEYQLLPYNTFDLEKIGQQVVQNCQKTLSELAEKISPGKKWEQILEEAKTSHPRAEEVLEFEKQQMAKAKNFCKEKDLVSFPENDILHVVDTPVFERPTIPYAAYLSPAPFDEKQEGIYWVTPVDSKLSPSQQEELLKGHNVYKSVVTSLHEAYPGHHLQLLWSNSVPSKVRKLFSTNVFAEGWALYCEEMMYEQGFYSDLKVRLFQVRDQLWRGCRVLIDVGIHTGKMSIDEGVNMLVNVAKLEHPNAVTEVKRYSANPTQPMSYVIGQREILKLRQEYKQKMGKKFNLKKFHDQLLSYGTIQIELIRQRMLA